MAKTRTQPLFTQALLFAPTPVTKDSFREVESDARLVKPAQLEYVVNWLRDSPELFIDYECAWGEEPFCLGAFTPDKGARVIDFRYLGAAGRAAAIDGLRARKAESRTVAFNVGFEVTMSQRMGFELGGTPWDPCAAAFAVHEIREPWGEFGPHTQKALCYHELKTVPKFALMVKEWLRVNTGQSEKNYELVPPSLMVPYNAEDLELGWKLHKHLEAQVERNSQRQLVQTDSYLGPIVSRIESRGFAYDKERAVTVLSEISTARKAAQKEIVSVMDGRVIDVTKDQTLFGLLYGEFRIPMHSDQEKTGKLDEEVLNWMMDLPTIEPKQKRVIELTLDLRELSKMDGTYLLPWTYEFSKADSTAPAQDLMRVLFPHLSQMGPRTRRFSANSPNLQNVPTRTELGKRVRSCIRARPGWTVYSMDESQAEYRSFAHYANAIEIIKAYARDSRIDYHQLVSDMMRVSRKDGKNLNFACLYGIGIAKLARDMRRSEAEARLIRLEYNRMNPYIKTHQKELEMHIRQFGYVRDEFGGRRHLDVKDSHVAINTENQMTVADLIRSAMVRADPIIRRAGGNLLHQVHDEILFELPGEGEEARESHKPTLRVIRGEAMENYPQFKVPFKTDCSYWEPDWAHEKEMLLDAA